MENINYTRYLASLRKDLRDAEQKARDAELAVVKLSGQIYRAIQEARKHGWSDEALFEDSRE